MHDWAVEKSVRNMSDEAFCLLQIIQGSGSDEDDPIKRQIDYFDMRKFLFYEMSGIQGSLEDLLEDRRIV